MSRQIRQRLKSSKTESGKQNNEQLYAWSATLAESGHDADIYEKAP